MRKLAVLILLLLVSTALAQQPQADEPSPEPIVNGNYQLVNGVGPGYWVYQTAAGLSITVGPGTAPDCLGGPVYYAGGTFTLTNNATNYVYLKLDSSCAVTLDTTGPTNRDITVAQIVTSGGVVTTWNDLRSWFSSRTTFGGINHQTGTSYTIAATDRAKDVTFSNSGAVAVTLPTTFDVSFAFAAQNLGVGTATFTPSSGTINGSSTLAMTTGQGGWLFFDGTNWNAVLGGSGGGGSGTTMHACVVTFGDPSSSSPVLVNDNAAPGVCPNGFGADETVVAVGACRDAGSPIVRTILTGGSSTSILTGDITVTATCSSAGNWTAGTVSGSPTIHSFAANGATCSSTPCSADVLMVTAGGTAKYVVVTLYIVGPGGTQSGTSVGTGGASNNQLLIDSGGLVAGVGNAAPPQVLTANGSSSAPTFQPPPPLSCQDTSGSGSAYVCSTSPSFTPAANSCVLFTTTTANTGTSATVNVNSLGAKSIAKWQTTTTLAANDIRANAQTLMCYDGTNWELSTIGNAPVTSGSCGGTGSPGLCLVEEHTASSSASLNFTSCISSTYDEYLLEWINIIPATAGSNPEIRMSTNGGSSYDSGANYQWQEQEMFTGSTGSTFPAGSNSTTSILLSGGPSASGHYGTNGTAHLFNPESTSLYKLVTYQFADESNNHTGNLDVGYGGGSYLVNGSAVNAFQFFMSSGNIASETVRCYGLSH